jgi:hypothetical protein
VSARVETRSALLVLLTAVGAPACGVVDPGQDVQFAEITYDQNFFYCKVEPMLIEQKCGPGNPNASPPDAPNGCHYNVTTFRLTDHATKPVPCKGLVPQALSIPAEAQSNYEAASREMSPDPDRAQLFNRPTRGAAHPRKIFETDSLEAGVIRQWATKYTSQ